MSPELIGILSVGVALAALVLAGRRDTARRLGDMDRRLGDMDRRLARVEGLLEGLGLSGRTLGVAGD